MKKSLLILLIGISFISCNKNDHFTVKGTVADAAGEKLYLEQTSLLKTTIIDSAKLDADGDFKFKGKRPKFPELYRLRMNNKVISFAVDSCELITIDAKNKNFATDYKVQGSEVSVEIQKLRKSVMSIQAKANTITAEMGADERAAKVAEIEKDIEQHKTMAQKLILQNPRSMAAYFAIYQQINNTYLFSPYVKTDKPYCAAVATSFNTFMPEYERTTNLYSLVMDAIRTERNAKDKEAWNQILETRGKGYIDIDLKDSKNVTRRLSELEGKVVLIDFSAYESEGNVDYTFALRELYNKYHNSGFEIYQISLDRSKLLWEKSIANIPWICVRDENGPQNKYIASYNVSSVPTTFLMDKKGNIIARSLGFDELNRTIADCLK